MRKKLLFVAMATVALASCSQDETVEMSKGKTIDFRATTEYMGRGTAIESAEAIGSFNVTALTIKDDEATRAAGTESGTATPNTYESVYFTNQLWEYVGSAWKTSSPAYWPDEGELGFYAYAPTTTTGVIIDATQQVITNFTPEKKVSEQVDLLVAMSEGDINAGEIPLGFVHALSQIEVKAQVHNSNFTIKVKGIKLANIPSTGTMTFPQTSTASGNGKWYTQTSEIPLAWETSTGNEYYTVSGTSDVTLSTDEAKSLMFDTGSFMLIPQTLKGYASDNTEGAYIAVLCNIVRNDGKLIYPSGTGNEGKYAYTMIPISTTWKPGYKYTYTLNFFKTGEDGTEGGAGQVDPNPGEGADLDLNGDGVVNEEDKSLIVTQNPTPEGGTGTGGENIGGGTAIKFTVAMSKGWQSGTVSDNTNM